MMTGFFFSLYNVTYYAFRLKIGNFNQCCWLIFTDIVVCLYLQILLCVDIYRYCCVLIFTDIAVGMPSTSPGNIARKIQEEHIRFLVAELNIKVRIYP